MSLDASLIIHPYTARPDLGLGHDRYAYELLTRLPEHGVSPYLFETGANKNIPEAFLAEARACFRLLGDKKRDLYHATATMNAQCAVTSRKHPLITTIHDVLWFFVKAKFDTAIKYYLKSYGIKRAAENSDAIIVPFPSTADFLHNTLKIPKNRIQVIHHGVDHKQFYPLKTGEEKILPKNFPAGGKIVLFVGAVNFGKGIDTLIRCFEQVVSAVPDANLVVGSSGWDLPLIKNIWETSRVKNKIHFTGFISEKDLRMAYVSADVMAFPSRYGMGLSTLESMACGTPTVSGRILDAPELVKDAGLMANPEDKEELASQIIRLLTDEPLIKDIKKRGIENAALYSWERTVKETAEWYRKVKG